MSSLAALPAIGEDTRTHAELGALLDALRVRGDSLPTGVHELSAASLLPRIPVRTAVRRRFHSSDLVLRRSTDSPGGGGGSLRRVALSKATAVAEAELLRLRRRRTRSETHVPVQPQLTAADGGDEAELYEEDDNDDDELDEAEDEDGTGSSRDEELQRLLGAKPVPRRASDIDYYGSAASSAASSLYSSPASTPHSRSLSFATDQDAAESLDKLRNLQKLFQEGFITVTEYKDRRLQLADELGMPERSAYSSVNVLMSSKEVLTSSRVD